MTSRAVVELVVWCLAWAAIPAHAADDAASFVNPFIGTGGHGHTFPGATLPFGMVQLSPDTRLDGWDGCSGYHFTDSVVYGFSHTHLSGTGVSDYGDILLMPVVGEVFFNNGSKSGPEHGYASAFDKATEKAEPGWYAAELSEGPIAVELTATTRTGMHRYRFPQGRPAAVVVDLEHRDRVLESQLKVVGDREIEGFRRSTAWAEDQVVYFVAEFSQPFTSADLAALDRIQSGVHEVEGTSVKAALHFGSRGGEILVKVGISAVDIDGARRNLEVENPGWSFDGVRAAARDRWNEALGSIRIDGATAEQHIIFATALYHSLLAPNVFSDVDGRYRGMDRKIHTAEGRRHYTVFSLWDTFRATHPLFTLIAPDRVAEMARTMLAQYSEGGRLPVWELAGNETDCMIGYHAVSVLADARVKGINGFDAELALEAMLDSATRDHFGLEAYRRRGFIGADDEAESVSKTLEYAYDDWCIAQMARTLGEADAAREFDRRSQAWRHLLDPESGFMRARSNQRWISPFDPRRVDLNYTEANSWQYSFFVPHDVEGLIEALGGDRVFVERLEALFEAPEATTGRTQADITGLIGQYAHGNEPSHHVAWLYHYAGRPDLGQEKVRQILETLYSSRPDGLSGNEDCGQMSSWYVLSSIGLYQVAPGRPDYVIGAPLFRRSDIRVPGGASFVIRTSGVGPFVRGAQLNGEPMMRSFLRHAEIMAGGELLVELGEEPGTEWGRRPEHRPRSRVAGERVVAAPWAVAPSDSFRSAMQVELAAHQGAVVRFVAGPSRAIEDGDLWSSPLTISETTQLRFRAETPSGWSPTVESRFSRIPVGWTVTLLSTPNSQYTAGGADSLVDGRRGAENWRVGGWQGYQYTDFEAVVDLGRARVVTRVGAGFLQDVRSWIWMPTEVEIWTSTDGAAFVPAGTAHHRVPADQGGVLTADVHLDLQDVEARFVKVVARSFGEIPDWHPGRGDGAFIFVDEIMVEALGPEKDVNDDGQGQVQGQGTEQGPATAPGTGTWDRDQGQPRETAADDSGLHRRRADPVSTPDETGNRNSCYGVLLMEKGDADP
jgi:predicted alpha-1,2-mannosidase